ncbi:unnamed protein product [Arabidopsis lyrata]|nr:unnamed protein product [Arabidopsis lyrata]
MNSSSITNDLILEILSRLPLKSVARFRCVSKRWASNLEKSNKEEEEEDCVWSFFTSPQLENSYEKSSSTLVAAAEFYVRFSPDNLWISHFYDLKYFSIGYAAGLLYLYGNRYQARPVICNPITGRSEKFTFIDVERFCRLINYKGKLAVIYWEDDVDIYELYYQEGIDVDKYVEENLEADAINELRLWILEDVEKQEWSKYAYTWTDDKFFRRLVSIGGVTASGEVVFSMRKYTTKQPFYVFYFNLERNTLQRVEIKGFGEAFKENCRVCTFVNHAEDLNVNDLKQLKSVHPPLVDK